MSNVPIMIKNRQTYGLGQSDPQSHQPGFHDTIRMFSLILNMQAVFSVQYFIAEELEVQDQITGALQVILSTKK